MRRHTFHPLCAVLIAGALSSCAPERADLEVELLPPVASRFVLHGNCFAGWYMVVDLLVHERRGVDVVLDSVSLRVEDDRTGELLGERMAEATFLLSHDGGCHRRRPPGAELGRMSSAFVNRRFSQLVPERAGRGRRRQSA